MAWTEPTLDDLRLHYPQFAGWGDEFCQVWLDYAIGEVAAGCWYERDKTMAALSLAAHLIAMTPEGEDAGQDGGGGSTGGSSTQLGAIKARTVGDVRVEYETGRASNFASASGGTGSVFAGLTVTPYGRLYLYLMRRNFPAVAVV